MSRLLRRAVLALTLSVMFLPVPLGAQPRDSLVIGMQQEPTSLDPTADATAVIATIMAGNVFETLLRLDDSGTVVPAAAGGWEISDDGLTYRVFLEPDGRFTDGAPFDAEAVVFTFERAMAEDSVNPRRNDFRVIESVEAAGEHEVVFTLSEPDNLFLFNLTQGPFAIVSPATAETNGSEPVGSGPYRLKQWVRGDRLVLERNDDHREAGAAALREVTYKFVPDAAAAVAALLAGDLDAFPNVPSPESLVQFERDDRFTVAVGTTEGEVILAINNSRPPFDDLRVRRAVNHLIDREALIEGAMFGYGTPIGSHFPPHHPAYVDLSGHYPLDPERAKALLAEAGFPDGLDAEMPLPPFPYARRSGEILAQQLAAGGIRVSLQNMEWSLWLNDAFRGKNYDLSVIAHTAPNDYGNYARGVDYFYGYHDPAFDALFQSVRRETDPERTDELLGEVQRFIADSAVHGFLFQLPQLGVYHRDLRGYWTSSPGNAAAPLAQLHWAE